MKVRNVVVASYWQHDKPAENHTGSFTTNGIKLWSYGLMIGDTVDGKKILKDYTAAGTFGFKSQTTSCHVGFARRHADTIL